eukprot:CAMPEP_0171457394 /NCGR_PEP_ID=MMETSP0945-20130129/3497_1 /TAXON_ID=109269 /ORGANISM="Vaucheria litorea, Strain CCMP2940" /LENGTH=171 /DNA_ID=CAMNT_0011983007 /DNA_START=110 /DNA_END=625 /DNA_ORIENTATION=-
MYMVGELKFGEHVGTDSNGNEYFENREYVFGTHRWVEYKDIHNYDSSTVTPTWHSWLHHTVDHPPTLEEENMKQLNPTVKRDDCIYDTHIGSGSVEPLLNQNLTGFRPRGYGFGNIFQKWGEPELFYKQPGHPSNFKNDAGRFNSEENVQFVDPNDPPEKLKEPIRNLEDN